LKIEHGNGQLTFWQHTTAVPVIWTDLRKIAISASRTHCKAKKEEKVKKSAKAV
jgi:hypothetical protein